MNSAIIDAKLDQIPLSFRLLVKEALEEALNHFFPVLDPDKIYINLVHDTNTSSETLTDALLKKSIGENTLLNEIGAGIYSSPTDVDAESQIDLDIIELNNIVNRLSTTLVNTYRQQVDNFWKTEELPIPQELEIDLEDKLLKTLIENSLVIEKVYQVDTMYPILKQTIVSHFHKKQSHQDINLLLQQNRILNQLLSTSDLLTIQSTYRAKLERFWRKNFDNYRALAKFSYLKDLLDQQKSSHKLSHKGLVLAIQALGFHQEELITSQEIETKKIPLNILKTLTSPNQVEVSLLLFNNQTSSDILKIRNPVTNDLLLYIPRYTPSFVETKEHLLSHWVFHQAQSPDNFAAIASHFPLSSRLGPIKRDAFLYEDCIQNEETIALTIAPGDIFTFIAERQKARSFADLQAQAALSDHKSTESAIFNTIAEAMGYIPHVLPNIHAVSSDLHELFPNPHKTAAEFMKKSIKDRLHLDIDPDRTFIRLYSPGTLPTTYIFIGLSVPGQKSSTTTLSLTEAALNNYQVEDAPFGSTTIIYQDPSGKGEYVSSDQLVNILPEDIEEIIHSIDLEVLQKLKLITFWNTHTDRIKSFIKHRYLQQALEEHQKNILSQENLQMISEVAFYSLALEQEESLNPDIRIEALSIGEYQSTDIFVFRKLNHPKVLLYIAGNERAFFPFSTYQACIDFLEVNAKNEEKWRKLLSSHFPIDFQGSVFASLKKGPFTIAPIRPPTRPLTYHPIKTTPIEGSLFEMMQKNIEERSYADAIVEILSDKDLTLNRIRGITEAIGIALLVPSLAFPLLNWVSLAALVTEASIDLYLAKNADTMQERHQAAVDAGFSSIGILIGAFLGIRSLKFSRNQSSISGMVARGPASSRLSIEIRALREKKPISEEMFFGTAKPTKVWQITASDTRFSHLDVKAWLLDEQFLLFTGKADKADHLIISSHGGYFPGSSNIIKVPSDTELVVLGPHRWELVNTELLDIAKRLVLPYGIINENTALPTRSAFYVPLFPDIPSDTYIYPHPANVEALTGTSIPGYIKNYTLSKYQKFGVDEESYLDIVQIVSRSRNTLPTVDEMFFKPVDILTIRNRLGQFDPSLKDLFQALQTHGIQYKSITFAFCRASLSSESAPMYVPPML